MAEKQLKNIFLSASIPLPTRHLKYYSSADVIAIRDAVIGLATVVLPRHRIIWGGHPSITPLIYFVMETRRIEIQKHFRLYQSKFFEETFPGDNNKFENVVLTENMGDLHASVQRMRERMFSENSFDAGVFIGGMEGIETEYKMFRTYHPDALVLPIASTGAATKILYDTQIPENKKNVRFLKDYGYMSLFQHFLVEQI